MCIRVNVYVSEAVIPQIVRAGSAKKRIELAGVEARLPLLIRT